MAHEKLTDRTALTTPTAADLLHIVDVSDTAADAAGNSKKITAANLMTLAPVQPADIANFATTTYVDTEVGNEESARIAADTAIQSLIAANASAITSEASIRGAADTALQAEIDANTADIVTETAARIAGDASLDGRVTATEGSITTINASIAALDTDDIAEGATNLYHTTARVDARIAAASVTDLSDVTSAGSGAIITSAERTKLAGIEAGAEVNPTAAEVKTAYESNANTNAFTDAEQTKLAGIAAGAEVNVNADWTAASGDAQILNKPTIPTDLSDLTGDTGDVPEGTNLYFTEARVGTYLSANLNFSEAPVIQITGNTALTDAHANRFLECTNGGAITLSISASIRRSAEIVVMQAGTGAVTITAGAGVTLRNTTPFLNITAEQYALIGLKQLGTTDVWVITGERKPS
jgi:hypothetical protein